MQNRLPRCQYSNRVVAEKGIVHLLSEHTSVRSREDLGTTIAADSRVVLGKIRHVLRDVLSDSPKYVGV